MPCEIAWEPKGVCKTYSGFVTSQEFMQSIARFQSDPRFDDCRYSLNDLTAVEGHSITEADVTRFAAFAIGAYHSNPNVRIAVVATDPSILALLDLYMAPGHSPYPLRIFPVLAEARTWLAG
jgi:hypothetical protein